MWRIGEYVACHYCSILSYPQKSESYAHVFHIGAESFVW